MGQGAVFAVVTFGAMLRRALLDSDTRRLWVRVAVLQLLPTIVLAGLVTSQVHRIPIVTLDNNHLPKLEWTRNLTTVFLCTCFIVERVLVWAFDRPVHALAERIAGNPLPRRAGREEFLHQLRVVGPMVLITFAWTAILSAAAWAGLQSLSDAERGSAAEMVLWTVKILPFAPVLALVVMCTADRLGRASNQEQSATAMVRAAPGETIAMSVFTLLAISPLTHAVIGPVLRATYASVRAEGPRPDLAGELHAAWKLIREGSLERPEGRIRRVAWGVAIFVGLSRLLWREPSFRRVLALQALAVLILGVSWAVWLAPSLEKKVRGLHLSAGTTTVAAVIGILALSEFAIIAVSHEFHDWIGGQLARAVHVPPDDDVAKPRVRLDLPWLVTKAKRRVQGLVLLLLSVLPWVVVLLAIVKPIDLVMDDAIVLGVVTQVLVKSSVNAIIFCFSMYWLCTFVVGKTGLAWKETTGVEPFFLPPLRRLVARHPNLFFPVRFYLFVLSRVMGVVDRPAALMERVPYEAIGLTFVRIISSIPIVYLIARPLIPVASSLVLVKAASAISSSPSIPSSTTRDES